MQQVLDCVHLCTYLPDVYLTYMYNYNSVPIMCWNMAGADATPRVATCIETNPSKCLWSQTLGNPQLRVSICCYAIERSSLKKVCPPNSHVKSSTIVSNGYTSLFAACQFVNSTNSHTAISFYQWCNSCCPA